MAALIGAGSFGQAVSRSASSGWFLSSDAQWDAQFFTSFSLSALFSGVWCFVLPVLKTGIGFDSVGF